jgi:hypothetical protein
MVKNEGMVDRLVRAVAGLALLVWAISAGIGSVLGIVLLVLAVVLLGTAALGFCALYPLLGINTTKNAGR